MPFEKGNKHGNRFSSTNQPKKNGRNKSIYTVLKASGYSASDIYKCFQEFAFYTLDDLEYVLDNENRREYPLIVLVIARAYAKAIETGNFAYIGKLMNYTVPSANAFAGVDELPIGDTEDDAVIHIVELPPKDE